MIARPGVASRARTAVALGLAVFLTLIGSGTATAAWTADGVSTTGTAQVATVGLTMTGSGSLTRTWNYTGQATSTVAAIIPLAVTNTGTAPLNLSLAVAQKTGTLGALITVTLWKQVNGTCGTSIPTSGTTAGTFDALPSLPVGATTVTNGTNFVLCVATRPNASRSSTSGKSVQARLALTGIVGSHWTVTATDVVFTQTVPA